MRKRGGVGLRKRLFLLTLLLLSLILIYYGSGSRSVINVVFLVSNDERFRDYTNQVIEAVDYFRLIHEEQSDFIRVQLVFVDDMESAVRKLSKIKPDVVVSVLHKPLAEEFRAKVSGITPIFINAYPFAEIENFLNYSTSWSDVCSAVQKYLIENNVEKIQILYAGGHVDSHVKKYCESFFDDFKNDAISPDYIIVIASEPVDGARFLSAIVDSGFSSKTLMITSQPREYWRVFGKNISEIKTVFTKAVYEFLNGKYHTSVLNLYGNYPDWAFVDTYEILQILLENIDEILHKKVSPIYIIMSKKKEKVVIMSFEELFGVKR